MNWRWPGQGPTAPQTTPPTAPPVAPPVDPPTTRAAGEKGLPENGLLLEAHDLSKRFGDHKAVEGVSLSVAPGQAYGLVGPDGAGKTTTMRLLVGALSSEGGTINIKGYNLHVHSSEALRQVGYLAQRFSLYGELTVAENLNFFGAVRGMAMPAIKQRSAELLGFVGLAGFEQRRAAQLSGGMKQKLGLACALIHRPQLLLLDEPTTGVDPVTRQDFWQLIIRLMGEGVGVVVSTPYMDEAARCSRLGFMYAGHILTEGTPRTLMARLAEQVLEVVAQPRALARQVCLADPDVEDAVAFGDRLHLRLRSGAPAAGEAGAIARLERALAAAGAQVTGLRAIQPSLEDVFVALLAEQGRPLSDPDQEDRHG
jgi:ABC-2 type transport system ATP-binding protein